MEKFRQGREKRNTKMKPISIKKHMRKTLLHMKLNMEKLIKRKERSLHQLKVVIKHQERK